VTVSPDFTARAYARSCELENGNDGSLPCCLSPPITSPRDAVRAAIVVEARAKS